MFLGLPNDENQSEPLRQIVLEQNKKNLKTQTRINQICCCNIVKTFQTTSVQKEIEMQPDRQMGDTQADKKY